MKRSEKTIYVDAYRKLVAEIVKIRYAKKITQRQLAELLDTHKTTIARVELCDRRMDMVDFFEIMKALGLSKKESFALLDRFFPF